MTQKKIITVFALFIIFFLQSVRAGDGQWISNMKVGDWFDVQYVKREGGQSYNCIYHYELKKRLPNGNNLFIITLKRIKSLYNDKEQSDSTLTISYGFDSYYPTFIDQKNSPENENKYSAEISSNGSILFIKSDTKNIFSSYILFPISPQKNYFEYNTYEFNFNGIAEVKEVTSHIYNSNFNISTLHKIGQKSNTILTGASFPLPGNAIIKGSVLCKVGNIKIIDRCNRRYLKDGTLIWLHESPNYTINANGSFSSAVNLTRPAILEITINSNLHLHYSAFMMPGDTFCIDEMKNSFKYGGNAEINSNCVNDVFFQFDYPLGNEVSLERYFINRNIISQKIDSILNKYDGKASKICLEFVKSEVAYFFAQSKFIFFHSTYHGVDIKKNKTSLKNISNYPPDFFMEADTMPVLTNKFEWGPQFNQFLNSSIEFRDIRLSMSIGLRGLINRNLFPLAKILYRGYPFYSVGFNELYCEMLKGYSASKIIESDYLDFINNCNDPQFIEPLKKLHNTIQILAFGNKFPNQLLTLLNGRIFDLAKYNGKSICLIFAQPETVPIYRTIFEKYKLNDIQFVVVTAHKNEKIKTSDTLFSTMKNVNVIDVDNKDLNLILPLTTRSKFILLDKWHRIVNEEINDPIYNGNQYEFENAIKNAITAPHYNKEKKASLYKILEWSSGSILFTVIIVIAIYRIRISRIKQEEAQKRQIKELEIKAIRSQMNPHFIFNALNSIQSLINDSQYKQANIYLAKFATLLRRVLHNSEKSRVSLAEEIEALELYCQLEQLRFEFKLKIEISESVNCNLIEIPGMMIQPLAENAIVHGLLPKGNKGELTISLELIDNNLIIRVMDNGAGYSLQQNDNLSQKGFGIKLVNERMNLLNNEGKFAKLDLINNMDNSNNPGTTATLTIPID